MEHEVQIADEIGVADEMNVVVTKSTPWAVGAFRAAVARFREAAKAGGPDEVSWALTEAVMWLDVLAGQHGALLGDATVRAMTFARARSHHHLASVIERPQDASHWQWRPSSLFPVPADPAFQNTRGERIYASALSGKPVATTLAAAERAVGRL